MPRVSPTTGFKAQGEPQWKPLRIFNLSRVLIAAILLSLTLFGGPDFLGSYDTSLLIWVSGIYTLLSLSLIAASFYGWPSFLVQVYLQSFADIFTIILITFASGGVTSGLGILMIPAIAGVSILIPGRTALFFAAVGALALLLEEGYASLYALFYTTAYSQSGLLGAALFATAFLAIGLAQRARQSEELATRRSIDLANMAELNEHIVNRMSTGIIVADDNASIKLLNQPSRDLLGLSSAQRVESLKEVSLPLHHDFLTWRATKQATNARLKTELSSIKGLKIRITRVGARKEDRGSIIYLEDAGEINRQIQETKLASLGRLTASIAHEIRNPLGAISHAAQLLSESPELPTADQRLITIINDHSKRMNEIIQNILQLSRKEAPRQEKFPLKPWLEQFIEEFGRIEKLPEHWAILDINPADIRVLVDTSHLHQVLWNLCNNAVKYGAAPNQDPHINFKGGGSHKNDRPYLDVIDHGPGIKPDDQTHLFEPFFTTSTRGTGLGLYISRQLCENNQGDLSYISTPGAGSCFRIQFALHRSEEGEVATRTHR